MFGEIKIVETLKQILTELEKLNTKMFVLEKTIKERQRTVKVEETKTK